MTRTRWLIVAGLMAALAGLIGWQTIRQAAVARCHDEGGLWDGANSRCVPKPSGPLLQGDIYRS